MTEPQRTDFKEENLIRVIRQQQNDTARNLAVGVFQPRAAAASSLHLSRPLLLDDQAANLMHRINRQKESIRRRMAQLDEQKRRVFARVSLSKYATSRRSRLIPHSRTAGVRLLRDTTEAVSPSIEQFVTMSMRPLEKQEPSDLRGVTEQHGLLYRSHDEERKATSKDSLLEDLPQTSKQARGEHASVVRRINRSESVGNKLAKTAHHEIEDKTPQSSGLSGIPLAIPMDKHVLSPYQALLRESLEFFLASEEDTEASQQGRKRKLRKGQVGIRCRHCAHLRPGFRTNGACTFPRSKQSIYMCAQNIGLAHLVQGRRGDQQNGDDATPDSALCPCVPDDLRKSLIESRKRSQAPSVAGPEYWEKQGCACDLKEEEDALWLVTTDIE